MLQRKQHIEWEEAEQVGLKSFHLYNFSIKTPMSGEVKPIDASQIDVQIEERPNKYHPALQIKISGLNIFPSIWNKLYCHI
jgi:hypothetical protein